MNRQNTTASRQRIKKATERSLVTIIVLAAVLGGYRKASAIGTHNSNVTPASAYTEFADVFQSAGGLFAGDQFGSGVGIGPENEDGGFNWVLTAGHVVLEDVNDPTSLFAADQYQFVLGANTSTEATEFLRASEVFVHPGYNGIERGVDLALVYYEDGFTTAAPAKIADQLVQVGDVVSIVGNGQTGTPATGTAPTLDGVKRAGQNIIESTTVSDDYLFYRFRSEPEANFQELGSQGLPGDSGGGWFIEDEDSFYLAGITSGGTGTIGYGISTSAVQVGLYTDWIDSTIASRTEVPEPSSMALLGIGGLIAASRRRKRQA